MTFSHKLTEGLDPLLAHAIREQSDLRVFAVISWGCAATKWIAKVLNAHPEVFCLHHANTHVGQHGYPERPRLDGVEYMRVVARMGLGYRAAGDVHGVSRHLVPAIGEAFGPAFRAAAVVRDPLERVRSQMDVFTQHRLRPGGYDPWGGLAHIDGIIADRALVLPELDRAAERMFVHGVNMLNAIVEEQQVGEVYRMEDLTSDRRVLAALIADLTGLTVEASWLDAAAGVERVNVHRRDRPDPAFEEWQIEVLRKVVWPDAWSAYQRLGYSMPGFL